MDNKELAEYVEKLKLGDDNAFAVIYKETSDEVYGLIYSYAKNNDDSSDLMQETYIQVTNKIGTIRDANSFRTWIKTIAANKCRRYYQKSKKEILLSEEGQGLFETQLEEDEEFLPQEILDSKEKQKIIKDIIDNLPVDQKTAIYLYYFNELSLSEVAKEMECSEGTVKSRLNYARKKIKAEVDTWEKKGTKLYGISGVPVLLLLLRSQLATEKMPLEMSKELLKTLKNKIDFSQIGSSLLNEQTQNVGTENIDNLKNGESDYSNTNTNQSSEAIKQTTSTVKKAVGIKSAIAGAVAVAVIGSGAFIYSRSNKGEVQTNNEIASSDNTESKISDNTQSAVSHNKNTEITLSLDELEAKKQKLNVRMEIRDLYTHSLNLYTDAKTKWFMGKEMFSILDITNAIRIGEQGNMTGNAEEAWASTGIHNYNNNIESILRLEEKLKNVQDFTEEEKDAVEISNQMITYFCDNEEFQSILDKLNEKFELLSKYDISQQDKFVHDWNEQEQKLAKKNVQEFNKYKDNLDKLKKVMETSN